MIQMNRRRGPNGSVVMLSDKSRVAVDMDIHGYIHGYIHVWIYRLRLHYGYIHGYFCKIL